MNAGERGYEQITLEPIAKLSLVNGDEVTLDPGRQAEERKEAARRAAECLKVPLDDRVPQF